MSYISYRSIHLLKFFSNNAIKSVASSSSLSHFIILNSPTLTTIPHIRRHYTTESENDIPERSYYFLKDPEPLEREKIEGLERKERRSMQKTRRRDNKKRQYVKENIVETNFEALEGKVKSN